MKCDTYQKNNIILLKMQKKKNLQRKEKSKMTEREKILKLVEEHKAIFEVTDMDVVETRKGNWLFCRYNEEDGYYDALVHFKTAEDLAEIMLGELALDIFTTIDCEPEEMPMFQNFADDVEMKDTYEPHIERLLQYLGK